MLLPTEHDNAVIGCNIFCPKDVTTCSILRESGDIVEWLISHQSCLEEAIYMWSGHRQITMWSNITQFCKLQLLKLLIGPILMVNIILILTVQLDT